MTALAWFLTYLAAGIPACALACATFHASARADDLSRTRNNAAGEKGEGCGAFDFHNRSGS